MSFRGRRAFGDGALAGKYRESKRGDEIWFDVLVQNLRNIVICRIC